MKMVNHSEPTLLATQDARVHPALASSGFSFLVCSRTRRTYRFPRVRRRRQQRVLTPVVALIPDFFLRRARSLSRFACLGSNWYSRITRPVDRLPSTFVDHNFPHLLV